MATPAFDGQSRWVSGMVQSTAADDVFTPCPTRLGGKPWSDCLSPATVSELAAPFDMHLPSHVIDAWRQTGAGPRISRIGSGSGGHVRRAKVSE